MDNCKIKQIHIPNLKNALCLVWDVFSEFEAPEYSGRGIHEFKNYIDYDSMKDRIINSEVILWGCYHEEKVVGVIAFSKKPHINLLFVDKRYHRKGIAKRLFAKSLEYYNNNNIDLSNYTVNSSPYAKEVYKRLGFVETDSEQTVNGIRFIPMKYIEKQHTATIS